MLSGKKLRIAALSTAVIAFAAMSGSALAQKKYDTGATDSEIKIGNIMPYSGPASAYGVIGKTEAAYFKKINDAGGINGRKINFISYDDGYSPPKTVEQARKLVESDEVLFIFNSLGTPPNSAIHKYMNAKKVPQLFVDITTPKFAAQAIKKIAEVEWKPLHILNNVAASVGSVIKPAGYENSQGIISAAYLKDVTDPQWDNDPGMKEFLDFLAKDFPEGNKLDNSVIVGYGVAQTMIQVLKQCDDDLTRANVMKQAANLKDFRTEVLLPGVTINTSPTDFAPISQLQLQRFKGERWELFGDVISGDVGG